MNTSSTVIVVTPPNNIAIASYWVYIFVYGSAIIINAPLLAAVLSDKDLRRRTEMQTIAQLTGFEIVNGVSYFGCGVLCLLRLQPSQITPMTPFDCILQFYVPTMFFATAGLTMTLFLISIDRVICVYNCHYYLTRGKLYHISMRVIPIVYGLSQVCALVLSTSQLPQVSSIHPASCSGGLLQGPVLGAYLKFTLLAFCIISVVVYGIALVLMKARKMNSEFKGIQKVQRERQNTISKFLGIVSAITALTLVFPRVASLVLNVLPNYYTSTISLATASITMLINFHSLLYALVFWLRKSGVRDDIVMSIRQKLGMKNAVEPGGAAARDLDIRMRAVNVNRSVADVDI